MNQKQKDQIATIISVLSLLVSIIWFIAEPKFETLLLVLSTIATVSTLYAGRKRIEKLEARYDNDPQRKTSHTSIALWGPTASGKTWFIHAFGRTLDKNYRKPIDGLLYNFNTLTNYDFSIPPADIPGTVGDTDYHYIFERNRTSFDNTRQSASSFKHEITILDHKGIDTLNLDEGIINSMENADLVILALDPTMLMRQAFSSTDIMTPLLVATDELYDPYSDYSVNGIDSKLYAEWARKLFDLLESDQSSAKKRYYAVCVMKADQINDGRGKYKSPDYLVKKYFGDEMVKALQIPDKERIKIFTVSSFGFMSNVGSINPSPNNFQGRLLEPQNWAPYHVEFPLFWAFEKLELLYLNENLSEKWWKRLTKNYKLRKYIRYPEEKFEK